MKKKEGGEGEEGGEGKGAEEAEEVVDRRRGGGKRGFAREETTFLWDGCGYREGAVTRDVAVQRTGRVSHGR